ncbi:hypothetical protein LFM09_26125 [Lentzea alba]|uniref:hypothetical protein n=1 Tax=Lentzea alba TaxID=2714351 RepID=UPI0039BFAFFC
MELKRMLAVGAVTVGALAGMAPTAMAHDAYDDIMICGGNGDKRCGYGGVTNSHTRVYSCDTNGDNGGFRTNYWLRDGRTGFVDDPNGSDSGCGAKVPGTAANPVVQFQVVWKATGGWVAKKPKPA